MNAAIFVFVCPFAAAFARPADNKDVQIVKQVNDVEADKFEYALETNDGTKIHEAGELKDVGAEQAALVVKGDYEFVAADGKTYAVTYTADENGFHPHGEHLPVAPAA